MKIDLELKHEWWQYEGRESAPHGTALKDSIWRSEKSLARFLKLTKRDLQFKVRKGRPSPIVMARVFLDNTLAGWIPVVTFDTGLSWYDKKKKRPHSVIDCFSIRYADEEFVTSMTEVIMAEYIQQEANVRSYVGDEGYHGEYDDSCPASNDFITEDHADQYALLIKMVGSFIKPDNMGWTSFARGFFWIVKK